MSTPGNQSSEITLALNQNGNPASPSDEAATDEAVAAHQQGRTKQMETYFRYDKERDKPSDVRTALLIVAVLMATTTYLAGLSPPGGVWQDNNLNVNPKQRAGVSIMGTKNYFAFAWFMFWNHVGFYSSLYMILFLTAGFPLQFELNSAAVGMIVTHSSSIVFVAPNRYLGYAFIVLSFVLLVSLPYRSPFLRDSKLARKIRKTVNGFRTTQQLPL